MTRDAAWRDPRARHRRDGALQARGGVAQVTGHVGADVGGRRQSPLSLRAPRAELGRSSQRLDATDGVASGEDPRRRRFELGGHGLVRLDGRLSEMPRPAVGLVRPHVGQHAVGGSTFLGLRQVHDGRADEGVVEREPVCCLVQVRESCLLGRREIAKAGVRAAPASRTRTSPVPSSAMSSRSCRVRRRKLGDPRSEERLEPSTERQSGRQRLGGCAHPRAERDRELQQREWVSLCLDQDAFANGRREVGEPTCRAAAPPPHHRAAGPPARESSVFEEVLLARPRCTEQADLAARRGAVRRNSGRPRSLGPTRAGRR